MAGFDEIVDWVVDIFLDLNDSGNRLLQRLRWL
jgi:hypothetical protein